MRKYTEIIGRPSGTIVQAAQDAGEFYGNPGMARAPSLPRASMLEAHLPPPTPDVGLERLRSGLLTLVRDTRQDDLTLRQLAVLSLLVSTRGAHTIRFFAATLQVAKPAITRAVDRLELHGLARRLPDPADGRSVLVQPTRRGVDLIRTVGAVLM